MSVSGSSAPGGLRTEWARNAEAADDVTLPVTASQVRFASDAWGRGEDGKVRAALWQDIETLAGDLWAARGPAQTNACWVTLAFAVGNFKRQGRTVMHPSSISLAPAPSSNDGSSRAPRDSLSITADDGNPVCLEPDIYLTALRSLGYRRGFGTVATGSTIASALWPDDHVILDGRDYRVAIGLLAADGASIVAKGDCRSRPSPSWSEYPWFRRVILNTTKSLQDGGSPQITVAMVQRATWMAFRYAPSVEGRKWRDYGKALLSGWPVA